MTLIAAVFSAVRSCDFRKETSHDVVHGSTFDAVGVRSPGDWPRSTVGALSESPSASAVRLCRL